MDNLSHLLNLAQGERTLNQYALNSGISNSMLSLIKTGQRKPSAEVLLKLSKNARNNVTYKDLMKAAGYWNNSLDEIEENNQTKPKGVKIPVLGTIPAGVPIEAIEEVLDYEEISEEMASHGEYFALKVRGNSMLPTIKDGDIVIVKKQDDAESGKICVVMINGFDATLKEIKKDPQGVWVLPHNADCDFKPTFFTNKEVIETPVRVIGVAVEIRRSL